MCCRQRSGALTNLEATTYDDGGGPAVTRSDPLVLTTINHNRK